MATVDWPAGPAWTPREMTFGISTPKSAYTAPFSGEVQMVGHLADRLRCTLTLPPCDPAAGQAREAFFLGLASSGDVVRMGHLHRAEPLGTLRGLPVVVFAAAAGARSLQVDTTPGATLTGGDMLGIGSQLLMVGHAGAVANGAGRMVVPLVMPLIGAVAAGASVVWQSPVGRWQLAGLTGLDVTYGRARWARQQEVALLQVA